MECSKPYLLEGLDNNVTYTEYASNNASQDALILAQQNAGNIEFLKQQVDSLLELKTQVDTLTSDVATLSSQVNDLGTQIADFGTAIAGSEPLTVTGTDYTSPTTDTTTT
jgi:archaellum component FlaC